MAFLIPRAASDVAGPPKSTTPEIAHANYLMGLSADEFVQVGHDFPHKWGSNGCTGPINVLVFRNACIQHDFGYRNYGIRFGGGLSVKHETKSWVDQRFLEEMLRACRERLPIGISQGDCSNEAYQAATAVRLGGDWAFFDRRDTPPRVTPGKETPLGLDYTATGGFTNRTDPLSPGQCWKLERPAMRQKISELENLSDFTVTLHSNGYCGGRPVDELKPHDKHGDWWWEKPIAARTASVKPSE